ncbi:GPI-anchored protein LLG1-like [Mangifera indica]|uniref:GPI-anchored protein LLG1-like n=1 Tax=Mangifera indica TaxID=29780 RepID=UPI001CFC1875|nr:GPI-anchored protein LLG1-like [Mangifera indica]
MELGLSRSMCSILFVFLFVGLSSSAFIAVIECVAVFDNYADDVFGSHAGRNLGQAKNDCPVDFKSLDFTILTSQCKGPKFAPASCCKAFKEYACPYADAINDPTTDCAAVLFNYIRQMGHYPPGVFRAQCREGKNVKLSPGFFT